MGTSKNIHIGPYMIVKGTKAEIIDREILTCSNRYCQSYKDNERYMEKEKFCEKCGHPVETKKYKENCIFDAFDILNDEPYNEEFVDELCWTDPMCLGEGVFIQNESSPYSKKRRELDEGIVNYEDMKQKEEKEWFETRYKKIIDIFKKELGDDSVQIKYGIFEWYN